MDGRSHAVASVEQAYCEGLRAQNPSAGQLQWRMSRFARGLTLVSEIKAFRANLENARVADLGAGHGGDCCAFLTVGARPIAVDFLNHGYTTLNQSLRGVGTKLDVVLANMGGTLPFAEGSLDVVLAMNLLEHLVDRTRFLMDLWRVLKPGGIALLTTPVAWKSVWTDPFYGSPLTALLPMPVRRVVAKRIFRRSYPFPLLGKTCYSSQGIVTSAERVGFLANASKYQDSPLVRRLARWPLQRFWLAVIHRYAFDFVVLRKPSPTISAIRRSPEC